MDVAYHPLGTQARTRNAHRLPCEGSATKLKPTDPGGRPPHEGGQCAADQSAGGWRRKPTPKRFHALMAEISNVRSAISFSENCSRRAW